MDILQRILYLIIETKYIEYHTQIFQHGDLDTDTHSLSLSLSLAHIRTHTHTHTHIYIYIYIYIFIKTNEVIGLNSIMFIYSFPSIYTYISFHILMMSVYLHVYVSVRD